MSPLKLSVLTALVTVLLTVAGHSYQRQGRREEAARLRSENQQLQLKLGQQRRTQLAQTGSAERNIGTSAAPSEQPNDAPQADRRERPAGEAASTLGVEYRNEGMATPLATLQTLAWACDHADAPLTEKLLIYDEDARQKALQHFAAQNGGNATQLPSLEAAAALLYIEDGMKHPYPGAKVLELGNFEQIRSGRVLLHLPGANGDLYEFQQTPEGWKLAVTMKVVDDYLEETARRQAQP